jgi:hypothetical protein
VYTDAIIRSPIIRSPDKTAVAWSLLTYQSEPEILWSQLVVHDHARGREKIVARARFEDRVLGFNPAHSEPGDRFHALCPVDWSPDGRELLFSESIGHLYSDFFGTSYLIFDRTADVIRPVEVKRLVAAASQYGKRKGIDFGGGCCQVDVLGWAGRSRRLIARVYTLNLPAHAVGSWSLTTNGEDPRFVSDEAVSVRTFGRRLDSR